MKKHLFFLIAVLLLIANQAIAKEYRIDKVKAIFDIPNNFVVATAENVPNEVINFTGLKKEEVIDYLKQQNGVLVGYKENHIITIRNHDVNTSEKFDDNLKIPEDMFNDPKVLESMKKNVQQKNWLECKVSTKRTGNAAYYIIDNTVTSGGDKLYTKHYSTIKNAVMIGIEGLSFINNNSEMDADLDYIIQHVKYDNDKNVVGNSQSNSFTAQPTATASTTSTHRRRPFGRYLGLAIIAGLIGLYKPIRLYFKAKKAFKLIDEIVEHSLRFFPDSHYLQKKGMLYFYAFLYKKFYSEKNKDALETVQAIIEKAFDKSLEIRYEISNKEEMWNLVKIISNNVTIPPTVGVDRVGCPEITLIHIIGQNNHDLSADALNYAVNKFQNEDVYPMAEKLYAFIGEK